MTARPAIRRPWFFLALLTTWPLAGCAVDAGQPAVEESSGTTQEPIWAQTAGVNQQLPWETITNGATQYPTIAAASQPMFGYPNNVMHVFYRDANYCLQHYTGNDFTGVWSYDNTNHGGCNDIGERAPAAVAWDASRVDVFWFHAAFGSGTSLMHRWFDGSTWHEENLGTTSAMAISQPAVASWGVGHIDVFWRDANNRLVQREFDRARKGMPGYSGGGWSGERILATGVAGDPTAVERTTNAIDLFWRGADGVLLHKWTQNDGANWSSNESLGIASAGGPSATSWGAHRVELVYATTDSKLGHAFFEDDTGSWQMHNQALETETPVVHPIVAAALGREKRLDVVDLTSGKLTHTLFSEPLPGYHHERQPNAYWCWIASSLSVIEYLKPSVTTTQCQEANIDLGTSDCCASANNDDCKSGGGVETVLNRHGFDFTRTAPLSFAAIRSRLYVSKQPVIVHHYHPLSGSGHYVVIRDAYHFNGKDYLVLADSKMSNPTNAAEGGDWVMSYDEYIDVGMTHPSWRVDKMFYDFQY